MLDGITVFPTNIRALLNTNKLTHLQSCKASWSIAECQMTKTEEEETWGDMYGSGGYSSRLWSLTAALGKT